MAAPGACATPPAEPFTENGTYLAVMIVALLPLVALYFSMPRAPTRITVAPAWMDCGIVGSTLAIAWCMYSFQAMRVGYCEYYATFAYLSIAVLLATTYTKFLRTVAESYMLTDLRPQERSARAARLAVEVAEIYLSPSYCTMQWVAATGILTIVGYLISGARGAALGGPCTVLPSMGLATAAFVICTLVLAAIAVAIFWLGRARALAVQCALVCVLTFAFLLAAILAHEEHWHTPVLPPDWSTTYLMVSLALYTQLLHFIVPSLTARSDVYFQWWMGVRTRLRELGLVCFRAGPPANRPALAGTSAGHSYGLDVARTASAAGEDAAAFSRVTGRALPRALALSIQQLKHSRHWMSNPPRVDASVTVDAVFTALITENAAQELFYELGTYHHYRILQFLLSMLRLRHDESEDFDSMLRYVRSYAAHVHIEWPDSVFVAWSPHSDNDPADSLDVAVWSLADEADAPIFEADAFPEESAPPAVPPRPPRALPAPRTVNEMHRRIYPAIHFLSNVLSLSIKFATTRAYNEQAEEDQRVSDAGEGHTEVAMVSSASMFAQGAQAAVQVSKGYAPVTAEDV
jgi:hypothetical protein